MVSDAVHALRKITIQEIEQAADRAEIVATVLDYFEGWFDGDDARMDRALHPDLVKRARDLETVTKAQMVDATAAGVGRLRDPGGDRQIAVEVPDVHGSVATAVVRSRVYREYVHLVRTDEGWKIVNALWDWA